MGNSNLAKGGQLIHIIDGTEDTEKIIELCMQLNNNNLIPVINNESFTRKRLADFIAAADIVCKIDLEKVRKASIKAITAIEEEKTKEIEDVCIKAILEEFGSYPN